MLADKLLSIPWWSWCWVWWIDKNYLDDLISDIDDPTSSNKMRIVDDEPDEEETSFEADLVIEPEATSEEESFIQEIPEPPEYLEQTETETSDDDFDLDDLISEDTSEPEPEIISEPDNSDLVQEDTSFDSSTTEEFTSDFNDSIEDSFQDATDYSAVNDYAQSDFVDIIDLQTYICSYTRTPIGAFQGLLSKESATKLGSRAIESVINKIDLDNSFLILTPVSW